MATVNDLRLIGQIADRAVLLYRQHGRIRSALAIADEILLVHQHIVPLRLAEMLTADDGNFAHDVAGINRHLERPRTALPYLADCFLPRFASVEV